MDQTVATFKHFALLWYARPDESQRASVNSVGYGASDGTGAISQANKFTLRFLYYISHGIILWQRYQQRPGLGSNGIVEADA
jgi:hypothetical protein